jgi:hypothetical protein
MNKRQEMIQILQAIIDKYKDEDPVKVLSIELLAKLEGDENE